MMRRATAVAFAMTTSLIVVHSARAQGTTSVEQTIVQIEKDGAQAFLKRDTAAVGRFIADDWVGIDFNGNTATKAQVLSELKSGASAAQSIDLGPLKVRVFGDTAIVNGSDTEKSTYQGKDSSGHYVFTDVFVKRNGTWQVVASHSVKTK